MSTTKPLCESLSNPLGADEPDWVDAQWIGAPTPDGSAPLLRRKFIASPGLISARLHFAAPGYGQLFLNDHPVEDAVLDPVQTDYDIFAFYRTFDVTALVDEGENALTALLGNGWFSQDRVWEIAPYGDPGLIALLRLEYADGNVETLGTDSSWEVSTSGPLLENSVYGGNVHDARREEITDWQPAAEVAPLTPELRPQLLPPSRRVEEIATVSVNRPLPGISVFDFGQNFSGWCRLRVTAPAGTEICLRFAEVLDPDGTINPLTTGVWHTRTIQTDRYICRGGGEEVWEPQFTCHSFRYVEVTGFPGEAPAEALTGIVVHSDLSVAGSFECSDPLLERIHSTARWTQRTNLHGLPTDCPGRERCGWLGDAHVCAPFILLNWDATTLLEKYVDDIVNSLGRGAENGHPDVPANIAPGKRRCGQANPDWAVALVLIPYYLHFYKGEIGSADRHFDKLAALLRYLDGIARDGIIHEGFGDWCPPGRVEPIATPVALTSTALYFQATDCLARLARALDRAKEASALNRRAANIRSRFIAEFHTDDAFGSQAADTLALTFGLCPDGADAQVAAALAARVRANDYRFDTGIHGLRHLFDALASHGYDDVCWRLLQSDGQPSFRHHFAQGGTTFWETFFDLAQHPEMIERSRNHPMQGAFAAWFTEGIGGIRPDPDHPGFRHLNMRPQLVRQLDYVRCTHRSPHGIIRSEWQRDGDEIRWEIELPAGVTADASIAGLVEPAVRLKGGVHSFKFAAARR